MTLFGKKIKIDAVRLVCGVVTTIWIVALLFPIIWMISTSMKTRTEAYKVPPSLIPDLKMEINVLLDYSGITKEGTELTDSIKYDIVNIVYSIPVKFPNDNIGAIRITVVKDGNRIAESYTPSYQYKLAPRGKVYSTSADPQYFAPFLDHLYSFTSTKLLLEGTETFHPEKGLSGNATTYNIMEYLHAYALNGTIETVLEKKSFIRLFDAYIIAWKGAAGASIGENLGLETFFVNSIYVAFMGLMGTLALSSLAAYSLSKLMKPRVAKVVLLVFLATIMVPGILTLIPTYELIRKLNMFDTYLALYIGCWFSPVCIFFFKGFFDGLPKELFESSKLDGANNFTIFTKIVLPLSGAAFGAMTIMQFIPLWNNFFWPFLVTQSAAKYTFPVALYRIQKSFATSPNDIMALSLLSSLPTIVVFALFQNAIQKGIVFSGLKG